MIKAAKWSLWLTIPFGLSLFCLGWVLVIALRAQEAERVLMTAECTDKQIGKDISEMVSENNSDWHFLVMTPEKNEQTGETKHVFVSHGFQATICNVKVNTESGKILKVELQ